MKKRARLPLVAGLAMLGVFLLASLFPALFSP